MTLAGALLVLESMRAGLRPDPPLRVADWANEHVVLTTGSGPEAGGYRAERTPYLIELMDCLSDDSPVRRVVFAKGAQVGGTQVGLNWIGYVMGHSPSPMMVLQPDEALCKRLVGQKLDPMIQNSPRLRQRVRSKKSRDGGNSQFEKQFDGGVVVLASSKSASALRSFSARRLFLDEVDAYPGDLEGEGDPVSLARRALRTYGRRAKELLTSTPTFAGRSRIWQEFELTDQRYYHVPCPHCGELQRIVWSQIEWDEGKPETVRMRCLHCDEAIREHHKQSMLARGEWIAEFPERSGDSRGYHISALYSPLGWYSWEQAVKDFLEAKGNPEKLRTWVNHTLGEPWEEKGERPNWKKLYLRRESYEIRTVPLRACFLTAGVDVQGDRVEMEVVGWGRGRESWSIDHHVIEGTPSKPETWSELAKSIDRTFPHEGGGSLSISAVGVDSGFSTSEVYAFVRKQARDRVFALKGSDTVGSEIVGLSKSVDVTSKGKKISRGLRVFHVGTHNAKRELYTWLQLEQPLEPDDPYPPGYLHFPEWGQEYFEQLCAEELVVRNKRGHRSSEWVKRRTRNEVLDLRVYARAVAWIKQMDRWSDDKWEELELEVLNQANPQPVKPTKPKKRVRRGSIGKQWPGLKRS